MARYRSLLIINSLFFIFLSLRFICFLLKLNLVEESKHLGANAPPSGTTKVFTDQELEQMIDPILEMDDKNRDGYIDYPEFVAAQKSRGF